MGAQDRSSEDGVGRGGGDAGAEGGLRQHQAHPEADRGYLLRQCRPAVRPPALSSAQIQRRCHEPSNPLCVAIHVVVPPFHFDMV